MKPEPVRQQSPPANQRDYITNNYPQCNEIKRENDWEILVDPILHCLHAGRAGGAQRQKILCPPNGLAHAPEQLLQISMALDEVNVIGIHHQKV